MRRLIVLLVWVFVVALVAPHAGAAPTEPVASESASHAMPSSTGGVAPLDSARSFVCDAPVDVAQSATEAPADTARRPGAGGFGQVYDSAGSLVAPSGLVDDGARFVVDSTGSTVLRAQGPQGWINVSEHASRRLTQRGIPIDAVDNALTTQPFDYYHVGVRKTGFYDAVNNLFVGTVDDVVTTVFHPSAGQGYIDNLLAAGP